MITFNETITIYSHWKRGREEKWVRTPISGVNWYGKQAVTVGDKGLNSADQYSVRLRKRSLGAFVLPDEWNGMGNAPKGVWTAQSGDVVVKGFASDEVVNSITEITSKYHDCFVVTAVHDNRREMLPHLRIEGK